MLYIMLHNEYYIIIYINNDNWKGKKKQFSYVLFFSELERLLTKQKKMLAKHAQTTSELEFCTSFKNPKLGTTYI